MKLFPLLFCMAFRGEPALPPIPATALTSVGPIDVHVVPNLMCNGEPALGCFAPATRMLEIRDSLPLDTQWLALRHEVAHAMFYYSNVHFASKEVEERLVDVIAHQQVMEMMGHWPR